MLVTFSITSTQLSGHTFSMPVLSRRSDGSRTYLDER
jgi:hypothetical protein